MKLADRPLIYEINTALFLANLSHKYQRSVELGSVPDDEWDRIAQHRPQVVWLMGVWRRSQIGRELAKTHIEEYRQTLPDINSEDIIGSAYSIAEYAVEPAYGGEAGLAIARMALAERGIGLILDFVPNHTGLDHHWLDDQTENYVQGKQADIEAKPTWFFEHNQLIFARGRDPNFEPWSDVAQLNPFSERYRLATTETISQIADLSDGVRCDMAMLMMNSVFAKTWGEHAGSIPESEFWTGVISSVKNKNQDFTFIAEAYWGYQQALLDQGFDYCYDKTFLDLIIDGSAAKLTRYLKQNVSIQRQSVVFLENHDEPRIAGHIQRTIYKPSAVFFYFFEGARMVLDGQYDGFRVRLPVQLSRGPEETSDPELMGFYQELESVRSGFGFVGASWELLEPRSVHLGRSSQQVAAYSWQTQDELLLVAANLSERDAEALINLPSDYQEPQNLLSSTDANYQLENGQIKLSLPKSGYAVIKFLKK